MFDLPSNICNHTFFIVALMLYSEGYTTTNPDANFNLILDANFNLILDANFNPILTTSLLRLSPQCYSRRRGIWLSLDY